VIGVGMVGSIVAKELAAAGHKVVGLERGQARFTVPEFQSPAIHDELRFDVRKALMQDNTASRSRSAIMAPRPPCRFGAGSRFCRDRPGRLHGALERTDLPISGE